MEKAVYLCYIKFITTDGEEKFYAWYDQRAAAAKY